MPTSEPRTDNGRTIASMYEAFGRGDVAYVMAQLAAELDWIESDAAGLPVRGRFGTPQQALEGVFAPIPQHFTSFELHPELWVEQDDDVVVTGRVVATTLSGRTLDAPYAHVFSFRDAKVCRNDNFHDTALWVEALS